MKDEVIDYIISSPCRSTEQLYYIIATNETRNISLYIKIALSDKSDFAIHIFPFVFLEPRSKCD